MKRTIVLLLVAAIAAPFIFQYLFGLMNTDHFYLGVSLIFLYGVIFGAFLLRSIVLLLETKKGSGKSDDLLRRLQDEGKSKIGE